ncbi:sigma-70 family RNA polymerase sigma factor [Gellertiella hungarica]|uniref:RNA polymerase sigma-70 factor (ECF subfamily) n=1 Tax=Gellertiella hungarica TaxID=1572859 RepID=A0A7W6NLC2_9HYPH|nr:RNA polymerase sigma-70 factor (ECF subfamily) [Gellertiella hungarica]
MTQTARETEWASWLRLSMEGDAQAYHRFLMALSPYLRSIARQRCFAYGAPESEAEDIVQEVLLAVHLKRGTWDPERPLGPWLSAIIRNKLIDSLRRKGRRISVGLDEVADGLAAEEPGEISDRLDAEQVLGRLKGPQRDIVRSISIDGASVRDTAGRLGMSEGAVRVALHRALKSLAAIYRGDA